MAIYGKINLNRKYYDEEKGNKHINFVNMFNYKVDIVEEYINDLLKSKNFQFVNFSYLEHISGLKYSDLYSLFVSYVDGDSGFYVEDYRCLSQLCEDDLVEYRSIYYKLDDNYKKEFDLEFFKNWKYSINPWKSNTEFCNFISNFIKSCNLNVCRNKI